MQSYQKRYPSPSVQLRASRGRNQKRRGRAVIFVDGELRCRRRGKGRRYGRRKAPRLVYLAVRSLRAVKNDNTPVGRRAFIISSTVGGRYLCPAAVATSLGDGTRARRTRRERIIFSPPKTLRARCPPRHGGIIPRGRHVKCSNYCRRPVITSTEYLTTDGTCKSFADINIHKYRRVYPNTYLCNYNCAYAYIYIYTYNVRLIHGEVFHC